MNVRTFKNKMIRDDIKVELPFVLPGLKKITEEKQLLKWLSQYDKNQEIIITPKLDGISILLDIKDKVMFTRGDNKNGFKFNDYIHRVVDIDFNMLNSNILFKNKSIDTIIPDDSFDTLNTVAYTNKSLEINIEWDKISYVRGELIMSENNFKYFKNIHPDLTYATARNLVAGMVNKKIYSDEKFE